MGLGRGFLIRRLIVAMPVTQNAGCLPHIVAGCVRSWGQAMHRRGTAILGLAVGGAIVVAVGACTPDAADLNLARASRAFAIPALPKLGSAAARKVEPVSEADLVSVDGYCPPDPNEAAQAAAAAPPAAPAPSTPGGPLDLRSGGVVDRASPPPPASPLIFGGVALQMTECQVVRRAGLAQSIDINADPKGERSAVLTYTQGPWPGIYRFAGGRLVSIDRVAVAPPPKVTRR
jgi:hypothetical protein